MKTFKITHRTDHDGRKVVSVPLANSDHMARLDEGDYEFLEKQGLGLPWIWNQERIMVSNGSQHVNVSRLIMDASAGQRVSFKDNDHTNLRRNNLVLMDGPAKYRAKDGLHTNRRFRRSAPGIEHVYENGSVS